MCDRSTIKPSALQQLEISLPDWVMRIPDWAATYSGDNAKMALAIELAAQNVQRHSGGPFGSAIFDANSHQLIAVGVNQVMAAKNSCLHGEMMAIMLAQRRLDTFCLSAEDGQYELFTSCEPCAMCLGAVLWSGVKRLVCAATGEDARAIGFDEGPVFEASYAYLKNTGVDIVRELQRDKARQVLDDYLAKGGTIYNG
ncbi:nucleoside deaminase [Bowmanella denitrificans]|uniref:Nucleoside deaminase n=1 Tax=Bowmanella denitrificans TaxID=366582 RepID=A0ABN0XCY8_9ALTE|nr:nucleoside deaminase [Bowmanella denitrificans]